MNPPPTVPLAGYGGRRLNFPDVFGKYLYAFYLKPSTGSLDVITTRALVLEKDGQKLMFVSVDLVGVSPRLREAVLVRLGLPVHDRTLFMSATHTHSGPGTYVDNELFEPTVTDRFQPGIFQEMAKDIAVNLEAADAKRTPARLFVTSFVADSPKLQKPRGDATAPIDRTARLLLVGSQAMSTSDPNRPEKWLGAMVNFAIHGTAFGEGNLKYSGDVPGAIASRTGAYLGGLNADGTPVPVVFINGAEGDVSPNEKNADALINIGDGFVAGVQSAMGSIQELVLPAPSWTIESAAVDLKAPFLYLAPSRDDFPPAAVLEVEFSKDRSAYLGLGLGHWAPSHATLWSVKLGSMRLLSWPGEPTSRLGNTLRKIAESVGGDPVWVMGLTNEHLAYFTTPEEFDAGGYAAKNSWYGKFGGHKILLAYCELLKGACP